MERWSGILKVPLLPHCQSFCRVGVSLCLSSISKTLVAPYANAVFFNGDRAQKTGNAVIERLSDIQKIAEILVSKFGGSVNAWVIEASFFNGPFAVYKEFIPSVNEWGEPTAYNPTGFPASSSIASLLNSCIKEMKNVLSRGEKVRDLTPAAAVFDLREPKTYVLGFSKGGIVINQLLTELAFSDFRSLIKPPRLDQSNESQITPTTEKNLLNSISQIHYVDVGLNSSGAYLMDEAVIKKISGLLVKRLLGIRFVLHGTPRQWQDRRRVWIREEKDKLVSLLRSEALLNNDRKLEVFERFYFADRIPDLQMHFEIIEKLDVS